MKKPFIVGITGGSGSGKTTFLKKLSKSFATDELCIISQDDYYKPRYEQLTDKHGIKNFDLPSSIDSKTFYEDIQSLLKGKTIQRKEYAFNNELAAPKVVTLTSAPVIVVEGIFIFHYKMIMELLDLKLFVHAKDELKIIRRIKRDREERNYPLEDVLYRYQHHVSPAYNQYIKPYMEDADMVINNNTNFEGSLEVIIAFLKKNKIPNS